MRRESCSSLRTWRDCKRKYHYRYEQQIEPVAGGLSKSLVFGTLVHAEMENYSGLAKEDAHVRERDKLLAQYPMEMEEVEFQSALARRVMAVWFAWWNRPSTQVDSSVLSQLQWVDCETEWSFPVQAGMEHVGKRDGYVRTMYNEPLLYELKTVSDGGEAYKYRLWMDDQIMANTIALRHEGKPVDGVLYDLVHKHKLRLKKDESPQAFLERIVKDYEDHPGEYFERIVVTEHMAHLGEYVAEVGYEMGSIMKSGPRPRTYGACMKFNSMCQYFELCSEASDTRRNGMIDFNYKKRPNKFSELDRANQGENNGNQETQ